MLQFPQWKVTHVAPGRHPYTCMYVGFSIDSPGGNGSTIIHGKLMANSQQTITIYSFHRDLGNTQTTFMGIAGAHVRISNIRLLAPAVAASEQTSSRSVHEPLGKPVWFFSYTTKIVSQEKSGMSPN